jgi:Na+-transporting NADH:ubiquinone oxidoreductase subunit NqrC
LIHVYDIGEKPGIGRTLHAPAPSKNFRGGH